MNKKIVFVILGLIILIAAALAYVLILPDRGAVSNEMTTKEEKRTAPNVQVVTPEAAKPGEYRDYSREAMLATSGTKLLFFHAPWCPQCREIEASIKADGIPSGVTVFKIDYDSNQKLRQQYGVTIQTTFVKVDDGGNKTASYVAYEEPRFSSVERELLP